MGQQCQAETFHGFIPCSLQSKTSLLAWTAASTSLCPSSSVRLQSSVIFQHQPASNYCWSWNPSTVGLVQWWSLQDLVSRCTGRIIHAKLDHNSCCHLPCQSLKRKPASSLVHFCHHSTHNIHWHPHLPHLPASEAHQAVEEGT